jgi:S-(hydroxymethyl)glutathione dehydrogenase/alcohol dehydrogenase
MKMRAAVVREINQLAIEVVTLDPPKEYEVLVRMRAAGVCHSDLHTYRGELRAAPPLVLGHEGAGVVEAVGSAVSRVQVGEHVLVNWAPSCNRCPTCLRGQPNLCERLPSTTLVALLPDGTTRLRTQDGVALKHYLSAASMAEYAVIDEASAIPLPPDVSFEVGALIGCAVMTGVGAVINTAGAEPGSSTAVIGCGGVGLSAIIGCRLAGCNPIIAVDVLESKLAFARQLGATHTINARQVDAIEAMRSLTRIGPDYVFDSVGAAATISQALRAVRPGGAATIMGMHALKQEAPIPVGPLIAQNKRLLGSFFGSAKPHVDLPRLVELYRAGRLPLDDLITKRYTLDELPQAFADMEGGHVARGVIIFRD